MLLLATACTEQTRSAYRVHGTAAGKPLDVQVMGEANTTDQTAAALAAVQALSDGLRGDLAGVAEQLAKVAAAPQAPAPKVPSADDLAAAITTAQAQRRPATTDLVNSVAAAAGTIGIAYLAHKKRQQIKRGV
jgi:hypothetical protein